MMVLAKANLPANGRQRPTRHLGHMVSKLNPGSREDTLRSSLQSLSGAAITRLLIFFYAVAPASEDVIVTRDDALGPRLACEGDDVVNDRNRLEQPVTTRPRISSSEPA